jgi:hypothetical protein
MIHANFWPTRHCAQVRHSNNGDRLLIRGFAGEGHVPNGIPGYDGTDALPGAPSPNGHAATASAMPRPHPPCRMIAKTFFLAKIIHRILTQSLHGKKSLRENRLYDEAVTSLNAPQPAARLFPGRRVG